MGRNTHIRSHRHISSGRGKPKRTFNWNGLQRHMNAKQLQDPVAVARTAERATKAGLALNACLLIMPWAILFASGGLV